ncbi:MAG: hypothetical protein Kow00121_08540 [Elainellaceae cyanobacterium]
MYKTEVIVLTGASAVLIASPAIATPAEPEQPAAQEIASEAEPALSNIAVETAIKPSETVEVEFSQQANSAPLSDPSLTGFEEIPLAQTPFDPDTELLPAPVPPAPSAPKLSSYQTPDALPIKEQSPTTSSEGMAKPAPRLNGEPAIEPLTTEFEIEDELQQLTDDEWAALILEEEELAAEEEWLEEAQLSENEDRTEIEERSSPISTRAIADSKSGTNLESMPDSALTAVPELKEPEQPLLSEPEIWPQLEEVPEPELSLRSEVTRSEVTRSEVMRSEVMPASEATPTSEVQSLLDALADPLGQVTSVSQLSDVQPTDWSYQALQSLVERYGVIVGYPDGTFQGDRALSRYEFAAALNAALDRLSEVISQSGIQEESVPTTDLVAIQRLQEEFAAELVTLEGQVDSLEARTAELEAQQFSTTVVLNGQVTLALADGWGGDPPGLGETNPILGSLAQLQLSGSFTGRDAFRINLSSGNFVDAGFASPQAFNTNMALLGVQSDTDSEFGLDSVEYRTAIGDRLVVTVKPAGFSLSSVLSPNSLYASSSLGALSRFASENSIFKIGNLDAGVGADWLISDRLRLQIAYGMRNPSDPEQGLFSSESRALGVQLLTRPFDTVTTGLVYVNAFNDRGFLDTFTGSNNADTSGRFFEPESATIHAIGGTLQWQVTPDVIFGAWGAVTLTDYLSVDAYALSTAYLFSLGFPDTFGREGDLFAVMVGQPFRLQDGINILRDDEGAGMHYEAFYRFRINNNISIVPGVFVVTDPGHIPDNNTIAVGAIRTVFSF